MAESFVSKKDRIIASAIDIISESGLSSLTTSTLAARENMPEEQLYKFFAGVDEVLVAVVDFYSQFDSRLQSTTDSKSSSNVQKIIDYIYAYATYYDNYYALATLMLQYEELLHNIYTREKISRCISDRLKFLEHLFADAIKDGELVDTFTPEELANNLTGIIMSHILNRRIVYHKRSFKSECMDNVIKWLDLIKVR